MPSTLVKESPRNAEERAQCVIFALGVLSPGAPQRIGELRLETKIKSALSGVQEGASPYNRAMFSAGTILTTIMPVASAIPSVPSTSGGQVGLQSYLSGVLYGAATEDLRRRDLPSTLIVNEQNREGRDISLQVRRATLLVYNFLTGIDGRSLGFSVGVPKDQNQVVKSFCQIIAANITSDQSLYEGAYHAAQALVDHLSRRGLLPPSERLQLVLTGIIVSAFGQRPERLI